MCNNAVIGNASIHNLKPFVPLLLLLGWATRLCWVGVCKGTIA